MASTAATLDEPQPAEALAPLAPVRLGIRSKLARIATNPQVRKSLLAIADQAVVSGANFLTNVIIGRACGKPELGLYGLVWSLVFFARGVQEQLVTSPYMVYCGRREENELPRYTGSILVHQLALATLTTMLVAAWTWSSYAPLDLEPVLRVMVTALPMLLLREFVRALSFAHLEATTALILDSVIVTLQLITLSLLAALGCLTVEVACSVIAAACGWAILGWFLIRRQPMAASWSDVWSDWRLNWTFGKWALASQLLASASPYILPWVVFGTQGEAETGGYSAASTIIGAANMFIIGMSNYLAPESARAFADGGTPALKMVLTRGALVYLAVIGAFCAATLLLGDQLAIWLFGNEYTGVGVTVGLLSLALLANSLGMVAGNGLWAMERPSANFGADVAAMIVTVIATVSLVPTWGARGAAAALICGNTMGTLIRGWQLRRWMKRTQAELGEHHTG
jgi:O-antigen/teichoic acid export membrane protein